VLLGYRLGYVPEAKAVHYDCNSWHGFLRKGLVYGRGAAALASIYQPHGAREKFLPGQMWSTRPERLLSGLYYWAGYRQQEWRFRLGLSKPPQPRPPRPVLARLRPTFRWDHGASLRVSDEAIFWLRDGEQTSVIVHPPTKLRIVLDSVGDFIWRRIATGTTREALVEDVAGYYGVARVTAASDLDDLVEELIDARVLVKAPLGDCP
jgi:hypothetical protein